MTSPRTDAPTNGTVRYAVVGLGQISQQAFLPAIARTRNSVLAALVTGTPEKAEELAAEYGVPACSYEDYPALLASGDVDAVYVATPVFRHREFAEPALEAGIHVLVEKPMETSVADCRAMIEAAERGGARLMVAYRLHHEPGTLELITRVRDEALVGEPRLFTAVFAQDIDEANHRGHSGFWGGDPALPRGAAGAVHHQLRHGGHRAVHRGGHRWRADGPAVLRLRPGGGHQLHRDA